MKLNVDCTLTITYVTIFVLMVSYGQTRLWSGKVACRIQKVFLLEQAEITHSGEDAGMVIGYMAITDRHI